MPNKKINQLDARTATSTDLMLVGDPTNGTAYKSTLSSLPLVSTSRVLTINGVAFDLSANRSWTITAGITSIGLSMPSAFSVASSPITSSGTIAVTGAGTTLQYIDGTGALQTFPTILQASDIIAEVRNQSGATMTKGTIVYISGATGNKPLISKALATGDVTSAQTFGLVQADIANNDLGYIVIIGNINNVNTFGIPEGTQLYLSGTTAGTWTTTKPYAPIHLVYIGIVLREHINFGIIGVKIQNGYEMDELHNVSAQSPANNDGLFWNSTTNLWSKNTIGGVLGYTPATSTRLINTTSPLTGGGDLSADRTLSIPAATTSVNGYLKSTDWTTFNAKESALTFSSPLIRTINTISIPLATTSVSGYLNSTDWNTFNNKQTALTLTTTGTNGAATLVGATLNIPQYSGTNIYNADGTLTGNRIITSNGNSLTFLGGNETFAGYQRGLWLKTSTNAKNSVELILENTFTTTGKLYEIANYSDGSFNIIDRTLSNLRFKLFGQYAQFHSGLGSNGANIFGTVSGINAFWFGQDSSTATSSNYTLCSNGGLTLINAQIGGDIRFRIANAEKMMLTTEGRLLLGTTTESTYLLDVNGTARVSGKLSVGTPSAASAIMEVTSTTLGFLPPRMTTTQRDAIATPATGLVIYNTTLNSTDTYDGARWRNDADTTTTNRQTASYSLVLADRGKLVEMNVATANTLTIPLNATIAFPIGSKIDVTQYGAGATTITATSGVTIRSFTSFLKLAGQYAACTLVKIGTDEWYCYGNLIA